MQKRKQKRNVIWSIVLICAIISLLAWTFIHQPVESSVELRQVRNAALDILADVLKSDRQQLEILSVIYSDDPMYSLIDPELVTGIAALHSRVFFSLERTVTADVIDEIATEADSLTVFVKESENNRVKVLGMYMLYMKKSQSAPKGHKKASKPRPWT
jgi:hypothetical protein